MRARRVLIVDDDEPLRQSLREALRFGGYEVLEAQDGTHGLQQAQQVRPDVILMDVKMPGIDGYETCRGLKENIATQAIPVIFVTAVGDQALNQRAYEAGGLACVVKPFRLESLTGVIEAAMAANKKSDDVKGRDAEPK
jgi:CheY-like chemotaxis protein